MSVDGNVHQLLVLLMNQVQILLIIHIILFQIKLINWLKLYFSMIENKMKQEAEWLIKKDQKIQKLTIWYLLLLMEIVVLVVSPLLWKWLNYSLKMVLLVFILKIKNQEQKNVVTWLEKSLFLHENIAKDYKQQDYKQILWELN